MACLSLDGVGQWRAHFWKDCPGTGWTLWYFLMSSRPLVMLTVTCGDQFRTTPQLICVGLFFKFIYFYMACIYSQMGMWKISFKALFIWVIYLAIKLVAHISNSCVRLLVSWEQIPSHSRIIHVTLQLSLTWLMHWTANTSASDASKGHIKETLWAENPSTAY